MSLHKLVIFDLDGVLFESRDMHFDTLNGALIDAGYRPILPEEHAARFNGLPTRVKLEKLGITGYDAERIKSDKQGRTLRWVIENVRRNEEFVILFTDLQNDGWKIAVASNAITLTVIRALCLLGLWELCDFVIAGDRALHPKPHPEMYFECIVQCDSSPDSTIIVEDSPLGIEGASMTGALVVPVSGPGDVDKAVRAAVETM